jgi:RNA recognition motif-containing protein
MNGTILRSGIFILNIYVGNLSYQVSDEDLRAAFETFGEVSSATVIKDKFSGQSKGFGFVEMPRQADAEAAIKALNGTDLKGRNLTVNMARPRSEAPRRNAGFGGR